MASSREFAIGSEQTLFISRSILTLSTQHVSASEIRFLFLLWKEGSTDQCFIVAPATGTPETGGWSTRELRTILRGLDGLNFIGADLVEVAPAYDTNAEHTTMYVLIFLFATVIHRDSF
jgi:arginase family protein